MINRMINKLSKLNIRKFSNKPVVYNEKSLTFDTDLQFSKEKLVEFGELERGEIPNPLKISPINKLSKTENNLTIVSEKYNSGLVNFGIYIKAGSRFECQEGSGAANLTQRMLLLGNNNISKKEVSNFIKELGTNVKFTLDREKIGYQITVLKEDLNKTIEFFAKLLTKPKFNKSQFEIEKQNAYKDTIDVSRDQLEATLDSSFATAFSDHQMGKPLKGNRDTIKDLSFEQLNQFVESRLYQSNIVVVGLGEIDCIDFDKNVTNHFNNIEKYESPSLESYTLEKPSFTPSLAIMRDDEMMYVNSGVFFKGPGYGHEDMMGLRFITEILGEYRADEGINMHLNTSNRQYNQAHVYLAECPDILLHKTLLIPYSDVSLIGGYGYANEVFCTKILLYTQFILSYFGKYVNQVDIFRTRSKLFNQLLNQTPNSELMEEVASQAMYLGRRIDRTEQAYRFSHLSDNEHIRKIAFKHFYNKELAAVGWGGVHQMMTSSVYNKVWTKSTLGRSGADFFLSS